MIVTYLGKSLVKIQTGDTVIALNPVSEQGAGKKVPKFGADIALLNATDNSREVVENVTYGNKTPFVVDSPGEYEISGMYITGIANDKISSSGKENIIYTFLLEGIKLCHLGMHYNASIEQGVKEEIGEIDILFVPIGGGDELLDAPGAYKIATSLEPRLIIPVNYKNISDKKSQLQSFLKEFGAEETKPIDKLVIRKKEVEEKEGEVVVLKEV